jgi:hypothetical protein
MEDEVTAKQAAELAEECDKLFKKETPTLAEYDSLRARLEALPLKGLVLKAKRSILLGCLRRMRDAQAAYEKGDLAGLIGVLKESKRADP